MLSRPPSRVVGAWQGLPAARQGGRVGCHLGCQGSLSRKQEAVADRGCGFGLGFVLAPVRRWVAAGFSCQWPYWVLLEDRDPGHVPVLAHLWNGAGFTGGPGQHRYTGRPPEPRPPCGHSSTPYPGWGVTELWEAEQVTEATWGLPGRSLPACRPCRPGPPQGAECFGRGPSVCVSGDGGFRQSQGSAHKAPGGRESCPEGWRPRRTCCVHVRACAHGNGVCVTSVWVLGARPGPQVGDAALKAAGGSLYPESVLRAAWEPRVTGVSLRWCSRSVFPWGT